MSLAKFVKTRQKVVVVKVKDVGEVRIKRLTVAELRALPVKDGYAEALVAASVLKDESEELFFASSKELLDDGPLCYVLLEASHTVNRLSLEAAEKK